MSVKFKDFTTEYHRLMTDCEKLRKEIQQSILELRKFNIEAEAFNRDAGFFSKVSLENQQSREQSAHIFMNNKDDRQTSVFGY